MSTAYAIVSFESGGYDWSLMINSAELDSVRDGDAQPLRHMIGDRMVRLAVDETEGERVHEAMWTDPSGGTVMLVGRSTGTISPVGQVAPDGSATSVTTVQEDPVNLQPTVDEVLAIVPLIQPIDVATWKAAIAPPAGTADPRTGSTAQPLRLGLVADPSATRISVKPWMNNVSILDVEGYPAGSFRLNVDVPDSALATDPASVEGAEVEDVSVRGVTGQFVSGPYWPGDSPVGGHRIVVHGGQGFTVDGGGSTGYGKVLAWEERGSQIRLELASGMSVDDALYVADGLLDLDDTQWDALLFPGGSDGDVDTTTTIREYEPTLLSPVEELESAVCRPEDAPSFVVLLRPDASADEITAVGSMFDQALVERVELLDQAAMFHELTARYADSPGSIQGVTVDQMSPSYRIWAGPGWERPADVADMAAVRGVIICA